MYNKKIDTSLNSSTIKDTLTIAEAFYAGLTMAQTNNMGFAAWRLPLTDSRQMCIGEVSRYTNLDELNSMGFILHPYDHLIDGKFIKAELTVTSDPTGLQVSSSDSTLETKLYTSPRSKTYFTADQTPISSHTENEYITYVKESIVAISSDHFQKVVPARSRQLDLSDSFDLFANFDALCEAYPNAFVSVVSIPEVGTWIGATPEVLINVENNRTFNTVSLAGTQKYNAEVPLSQVAWTQKEIEEQAMVGRYIINCFKKIRLRDFEENGPKTVIAGNLIHLKTEFNVDMEATNFPQLGSVMLDLLHPTSAVCGMPKEAASQFIKEHEPERGFYSGYLGPVNHHGSTNLFVNLRCAQLSDDKIVLYAGAGVTGDSIPEKEWLETEMKMNTLLNVIKL